MSNELLQQAVKALNLSDIYLKIATLMVANDFDPKLPNQKLAAQLSVNIISGNIVVFHDDQKRELLRLFRVNVDIGVRCILEGKESEIEQNPADATKYIKSEIKATFVAEYQLTDKDVAQEALNVFALRNAALHVWPYLREYVHDVLMRARLPMVMLPMYTTHLINQELPQQAPSSETIQTGPLIKQS